MRGFKDSNENREFEFKKNNLAKYNKALNLQKKGHLNQAAQIYHQLIKNKYFEEKYFLITPQFVNFKINQKMPFYFLKNQ